MSDIVITLPATVSWKEYRKELEAARHGAEMHFRLPSMPKDAGPGDRCYVVHQGLVRGYMRIQSIGYNYGGFTCSTTGREWEPGYYVTRTGAFHYIYHDQPAMRGFQGWRYFREPVADEQFDPHRDLPSLRKET